MTTYIEEYETEEMTQEQIQLAIEELEVRADIEADGLFETIRENELI